jgi:hypothetical protein
VLGTVVVVGLVVVGVQRLSAADGTESTTSTPSTTSEPTTSESATTTESSSATPSDPAHASEPDWKQDAKDAARDGLAVVVPARVPRGWVFETVTYDDSHALWLLDFRAADGAAVKLGQSKAAKNGGPAGYLADCRELRTTLDLTDYGTGEWSKHECGQSVAISFQFPSSHVAISAHDFDTARSLARQLLTYEYTPGGTTEDD